ncbi:cactin [Senna tora]|uniref:Cactin n=1 Tax=Senna tora TaxID=362788 RepID=A0A834TJN2_9FABA|nr:cactin [Senna tora]
MLHNLDTQESEDEEEDESGSFSPELASLPAPSAMRAMDQAMEEPRKPKYLNHVHIGYVWNKYNQTHYGYDNPPPKIVQGPDLVDKTKAPNYTIEKDDGSSNGYVWNKYNQTHYGYDNPPPKIVQGYKFNIFYPDLVDKTRAPNYIIEKDDDGSSNGDTCIIRFHTGSPYEDIAFWIVNKEWEYSRKNGFKCSFDNRILHLHFNFKRYCYRRSSAKTIIEAARRQHKQRQRAKVWRFSSRPSNVASVVPCPWSRSAPPPEAVVSKRSGVVHGENCSRVTFLLLLWFSLFVSRFDILGPLLLAVFASLSMASSSIGESRGIPVVGIRNTYCECGIRARIMISESERNPNRLYATCAKYPKCNYYVWLTPRRVGDLEPSNQETNNSEQAPIDNVDLAMFEARVAKIESMLGWIKMCIAFEAERRIHLLHHPTLSLLLWLSEHLRPFLFEHVPSFDPLSSVLHTNSLGKVQISYCTECLHQLHQNEVGKVKGVLSVDAVHDKLLRRTSI